MKIFIIIGMAIAILTSCGSGKPERTIEAATPAEGVVQLTGEQLNHAHIVTGNIEQKEIASVLKVNGTIEVPPQNIVSVCAPLGGYLKSSRLIEGMHVNKGEIIAVMEDPQYIQLQQDYLTAVAEFGFLEKEFFRQRDLNESKASSDKVFEKAQAAYLSQKVLIRALSEKLNLIGIRTGNLNERTISRSINIYAPISGFVSAVKVNIGKYAGPTEVLFELVNPADIHLVLTVFEKDIDKIFIGQRIVAYTNNRPEKQYSCKVSLIGRDISAERAVVVHCHFEQFDKELIPGMYMNAAIEVSSRKAFVIEDAGLVRFQGKFYVFSELDKGKFQIREVLTLGSEAGLTQISFTDSTDRSQEKFVTKGAYTLLMKMKNTVEE